MYVAQNLQATLCQYLSLLPPLDVTDYNPNLIILIVSFWYYLLYLYQA